MSKDRLVYLGIATILGITACESTPTPSVNIPSPTQAPLVEPEVDLSMVDLYYPQLRAFPFKTGGEIRTPETTSHIYSFADTIFYPRVAGATFDFFEKLAKTQRILQYNLDGQTIPLALNPRPKKERVVFVIPKNAPLPTNWGDVAKEGSTYGGFENLYTVFTRFHESNLVPPSSAFTNRKLAFSKIFSVEACQSSVQTASSSPELATLGQEIICNSYGSAFTTKQMRVSYRDYAEWARGVKIAYDAFSPAYPLYVLSEQEYTEIPVVGFPTPE